MNSARQLPRPDLSDRPYKLTVERVMTASPHALYRAWTDRFDAWFAAPGLVQMRAVVGEPFVFQTNYQGALHA
jgi:uncharacterized protein YndB with AHSA1/START domain